ncbi:MAG: helix-turn-helix transcriptional regulator [Oscillospiraceae bacterium]|nr:helix-turn-helix transcriptional regulator [Oscillospiraceae bacterium]
MDIGKNIADLRKRNGISQEKLAEMLDISRQAVTKWESGKANPDTENLVRLAEIFGVSVDEICRGETFEKPKKINYVPGHILALFSVLIVAAYCTVGGLTQNFNGEVLIALIILALPMHCFTHLIFWGMAKSGEFSMLAGYDSSIKYDAENMKRYVTGLDFMTGFETVSYLFIISATALIIPELELYGILLVGHIISYVAGIFFVGYKYGDKIYADPADAKTAKRGLPSSIILISLILLSVFWFMLLFELKDFENNTARPFPMLGMMFLSVGFALAGYLFESKRLKKADEHAPLFGKHFIVLNLCAIAAMAAMTLL